MYNTNKNDILKYEFKKKLRYNEYYNTQNIFDNLYKQSKENCKFKNLYDIIISDKNILLAYRNIKRNTGSTTAGTNNKTIKYWENKKTKDYINYIKNRLANYQPQKVRRTEIPKSNGKMRPLGIPNIEDRIIQQCIKQVLEPILEAKFHDYSYGFRPNRGTNHAIAHVYKRINIEKSYYVVNVDIKSFFDEVNHSKLLKQLWSLGIQDKKLISIISKMLKAEIENIGIPTKGVPQGGILSPLLANVVLNEFDWWISNQWQTFDTNHNFGHISDKYEHLRRSNLKEMYIVRYADDFLIFCKNKEDAENTFHAIKHWLKKRLDLSINEEKSHIVDIRKNSINYLGFRIKAFKKSKKWIVKSHVSDKACDSIISNIKKQVKYINKNPNGYTVYILNRLITGLHNYYCIATEVNKDFGLIDFKLLKFIRQCFKRLSSKCGNKPQEYINKYSNYKGRELYIQNNIIYPIYGIKTKPPMLFNKDINNYTKKGREKIHKRIGFINKELLNYYANHPIDEKSVEYNDNRLSLYIAQKGKCPISKMQLDEYSEIHHIKPIRQGGTDKYNNLIILNDTIHKLIHIKDRMLIYSYINLLDLNQKAINKINKYRISIGNTCID